MTAPKQGMASARQQLAAAVCEDRADEAIALLEQYGRPLIRAGVVKGDGDFWHCLAQVCVDSQQFGVLAAITKAEPAGLTLQDLSEVTVTHRSLTVTTSYSFKYLIEEQGELEVFDALLHCRQHQTVDGQLGDDVKRLHDTALFHFASCDNLGLRERLEAMCRRLLEADVGFASNGSDFIEATFVHSALHRRPQATPSTLAVMREYVRHGRFDIDRQMKSNRRAVVMEAVGALNWPVACELIAMGCDLAPVEALLQPGVLERMIPLQAGEMAPRLREAVMRRRLAEDVSSEQESPARPRRRVGAL